MYLFLEVWKDATAYRLASIEWLVIYMILCLWNIIAMITPGGAPMALNVIASIAMAGMVGFCIVTIRERR